MENHSINDVLWLHYNEVSNRNSKKIKEHLQTCKECREYSVKLKSIGSKLNYVTNLVPSQGIVDSIMENIGQDAIIRNEKSHKFILPYLRIILGSILLIIFILLMQIYLPISFIWQSIHNGIVLDMFEQIGLSILMFLTLGSIITILCIPVIIIKSANSKQI